MKYGNRKTHFMGEVFDSKKELLRYHELAIMEKAGKISDLQRQVKFELIPKQQGERAVTYSPDFTYVENGLKIAEDVKSTATAKDKAYVLKRKMFKQRYPDWTFKEVL
jgi:hypothetical protein